LFLTGLQWSSTQKIIEGHPSGVAWRFDFNDGDEFGGDELWFPHRALCVRGTPFPRDEKLARETQARGFWIDPSTGLMWAGKDNGRPVDWYMATEYCRDLRLADYSDWRLATLEELKGIYDKNANAAGRDDPGEGRPYTWRVKGELFLTGSPWSSSLVIFDNGNPSGSAWYFEFNSGRAFNSRGPFYQNKRALCVRGSEK